MRSRHPLPRLWLLTDERAEAGLFAALGSIPRGTGIIFRHHATQPIKRRALFDRVRAVARKRRLPLILAGSPRLAQAWRADGAHGRSPHRLLGMIRTAPVHDRREIAAANRAGVDLMLLSPVFPTRSHPGARTLGVIRFALLARHARCSVIALGGMTAARAKRLRSSGAYGWAAIDALSH